MVFPNHNVKQRLFKFNLSHGKNRDVLHLS